MKNIAVSKQIHSYRQYCHIANNVRMTGQGRIEYFGKDMHAADCVYHRSCDINFRTIKGIPVLHQDALLKKGTEAWEAKGC